MISIFKYSQSKELDVIGGKRSTRLSNGPSSLVNLFVILDQIVKMAGKLTDADMDQLEQWVGTGQKTFTLLYAITRDGCANTTFHQTCDNKGATVTVLYNEYGSVYGGYTSLSWNSNGQYVNDGNGFLFQLRFSGNTKATKFPVTKATHAQYSHSTYGPTFGAGHDLHTFSGTINKSGTTFPLNGYMTGWGNSYSNQGVTAANINNGTMNVTELEVYAIAGK